MADRHAAEAHDDPEPMPVDETAQRLLNLLFVLNAAPRPLATEEIVSDSDLGYGSGNRASDLRKFRRDREKLEERGVYIAELKTPGSSETEQSAWALDRARTFAAGGLVREEDARLLVATIDAIPAGINKINVDTDIRLAVTRNMRELFEREPELKESSLSGVWQLLDEKRDQFDPRAFLPPVYDLVMYGTVADDAQAKLVAAIEAGVKEAVGTLIVQFGSYGKAPLVEIATLDEMAERYAKAGK